MLATKLIHVIEDLSSDQYFNPEIDVDPKSWPLVSVPILDLDGNAIACVELVGGLFTPAVRAGRDGGDGRVIFTEGAQWLTAQLAAPLTHVLKFVNQASKNKPVTPSAMSPRLNRTMALPTLKPHFMRGSSASLPTSANTKSAESADDNRKGSGDGISSKLVPKKKVDFSAHEMFEVDPVLFQELKQSISSAEDELKSLMDQEMHYKRLATETEELRIKLQTLESERRAYIHTVDNEHTSEDAEVKILENELATLEAQQKGYQQELAAASSSVEAMEATLAASATSAEQAALAQLEEKFQQDFKAMSETFSAPLTAAQNKLDLLIKQKSEMQRDGQSITQGTRISKASEEISRLQKLLSERNRLLEELCTLEQQQLVLSEQITVAQAIEADVSLKADSMTVELSALREKKQSLEENETACTIKIATLEQSATKKDGVIAIMQQQIVKLADEQSKGLEHLMNQHASSSSNSNSSSSGGATGSGVVLTAPEASGSGSVRRGDWLQIQDPSGHPYWMNEGELTRVVLAQY